MHKLFCVYYHSSRYISCPDEKHGDMRDLCSQAMCLLTTLIAAKGSGIAQLIYQKGEKAVSLPKISINIFDVSKGWRAGGGGGGRSREKGTNDVSCG